MVHHYRLRPASSSSSLHVPCLCLLFFLLLQLHAFRLRLRSSSCFIIVYGLLLRLLSVVVCPHFCCITSSSSSMHACHVIVWCLFLVLMLLMTPKAAGIVAVSSMMSPSMRVCLHLSSVPPTSYCLHLIDLSIFFFIVTAVVINPDCVCLLSEFFLCEHLLPCPVVPCRARCADADADADAALLCR